MNYSHFGKLEYWDDFYYNKKIEDFDWFQTYDGFKDIIYLTIDELVNKSIYSFIDLGCGVSRVLPSLYLDGFENLHGVDVNKQAIEIFKQKNSDLVSKFNRILNSSSSRCKVFKLS